MPMSMADRLSYTPLAPYRMQGGNNLESLILRVNIVLLFHGHVRRVKELDVAIALAYVDVELG